MNENRPNIIPTDQPTKIEEDQGLVTQIEESIKLESQDINDTLLLEALQALKERPNNFHSNKKEVLHRATRIFLGRNKHSAGTSIEVIRELYADLWPEEKAHPVSRLIPDRPNI